MRPVVGVEWPWSLLNQMVGIVDEGDATAFSWLCHKWLH